MKVGGADHYSTELFSPTVNMFFLQICQFISLERTIPNVFRNKSAFDIN